MRVLGIDPGRTGAICALGTDTRKAIVMDIPFRPDGIVDYRRIKAAFGDFAKYDRICLEKVAATEEFGVASCFGLGRTYGMLLMLLSPYPHTLVLPRVWQAAAHVGTNGKNGPKERSLEAFTKLNPNHGMVPRGNQRKIRHDLIDAFLIAHYGVGTYTSGYFVRDLDNQLDK